MSFQKQRRAEFGRTWAAPRGQAAAEAAAAAGSRGAPPATSSVSAAGQAVASFYGALVQTSGQRWVRGGQLLDGEVQPAAAAAAGQPSGPAAAAGPAPAAAAGSEAGDDGAPSHAGLGSAAAQAELEAEAAQLQYAALAGPAPREQHATIQLPAGGGEAEPAGAARHGPREGVRYGIARSNVGFKLLKKAGWTEGAGLGAREQGMPEPLAASQQKGNLGLGYAPKPPPKKKDGGAAAAASAAAGSTTGAAGAAQYAKRPLPEDPLAKEDTATKVKRVKQVMQAEADDKAGKAIARYMRMAFNDATGEPTRDSNPLLRRNHKLSATNPLL